VSKDRHMANAVDSKVPIHPKGNERGQRPLGSGEGEEGHSAWQDLGLE
jgi:hypothetical protein